MFLVSRQLRQITTLRNFNKRNNNKKKKKKKKMAKESSVGLDICARAERTVSSVRN